MSRHPFRPAPVIVAQAQHVLAHPGPDLSDPQRLMAWAILKGSRGQRINQTRLQREQNARRTPPRPTPVRTPEPEDAA